MQRSASIKNAEGQEQLEALLPANYKLIGDDDAPDQPSGLIFYIEGEDSIHCDLKDVIVKLAAASITATEITPCPACHAEDSLDSDAGNWYCQACGWQEFSSCGHPGRGGCQACDACANWGDQEYHRQRDEGRF